VSRSLNKVILIGNLGADPEVRSTNNGSRVATLSVATGRHRVICWNNKGGSGLADVCEKYLKKGDKVYIEGRIEYRTWEDNNKQTRYVTEIIARELIMLGSKGAAAPVGAGAVKAGGVAESGGKAPESLDAFPEALDEEDDDLPF
jgi:single-strand DNA-binding protein